MKKLLSLFIAAIMCFSMMSTVFAAEFNFTDVKTSDWFYNDVKSAVEMGLINGKSPTTYAPNDNLTYAEAFKLAACMNQLYTEGVVTLTSGNPWYKSYVDYCSENDIGDDILVMVENRLTQPATREAYMAIFAESLPDEGLKAINNIPDDSIPDFPSERSLARYIYKLYRAGILTGVDEAHNCNPEANIKRSEVAAILTRMMDESKRVEFNMGNEEQKPEEKEPKEKEPEEKEPEVKEPEEKEPETTEPLAIKTQPGEKTAATGTEVEFTIEAEGGKAPYTYQWRHEVGGAKKVASDIPGETNATIKRTAPAAGGSTTFWCVITDANGDTVTSEDAVLTGKAETSGGAKDKFEQSDAEEPKKEDFTMTIDDFFVVTGRGIIITGYVAGGKLEKGDTIYINDADGKFVVETKAVNIEMFRKLLDECEKGDTAGIQLDLDVETWRAKLQRGYVASATKGTTSGGRQTLPTGKNEYME